MKFFAVFVIAPVGSGFAATSRAADRAVEDEGVSVGFPGGKIDEGESLVEAAIRESQEEGWDVSIDSAVPCSVQIVQGKKVAWLKAFNAVKRVSFKEQGRIVPVVVCKESLVGFGNEKALAEAGH
jgi:hypothetical protein